MVPPSDVNVPYSTISRLGDMQWLSGHGSEAKVVFHCFMPFGDMQWMNSGLAVTYINFSNWEAQGITSDKYFFFFWELHSELAMKKQWFIDFLL